MYLNSKVYVIIIIVKHLCDENVVKFKIKYSNILK